jgi:hypothetical protein
MNDRFLGFVFVILITLAAIHLLGKRSLWSGDPQIQGVRPATSQPAAPPHSQKPPAP